MTPEQRRMIPPYRTQEFPYEEQTIREMNDNDLIPERAKGGEVTEHALPDWAKPYLAAGIRAHARGEHFYGSSPTYEEELAAFKQAHEPEAPVAPTAPEGYAGGGATAAYSDLNPPPNLDEILKSRPKRSPQEDAIANEYLRRMQEPPINPKIERLDTPKTFDQMPNLPVPGTSDPMPNVTRFNQYYEPLPTPEPQALKHGGKAATPEAKKLGTIADGFSKRLDNINKLLTSLEKAYAKKPNTKLAARISKSKDEAKRIQDHIEKVRSFH